MSSDKSNAADNSKGKSATPQNSSGKLPTASTVPAPPAGVPPPVPRLYRNLDWITFGVTTLLVLIGYCLTLAPDLTLEDSGELAVGSYYAGVPHPPGYPVWTIYTWLFTLLPISNIAWRVAFSSAVAGAFACGLLSLMVSRGSSLLLESIAEFKGIDRRWENAICAVSGFVAGSLLGFNGFMWSQAIIVEVYTLSMLSFMAVLACLFRWMYAPHQRRYIDWAFFWFGICFTNHQTLIVSAMGIEVLVAVVDPRLGRHLFIGNSLVYILGLVARAGGMLTTFDSNPPLFVIYNLVGVGSIIFAAMLSMRLRITMKVWQAFFRDLLLAGALGYIAVLVAFQAEVVAVDRKGLWFAVHVLGLSAIGGCAYLLFLLPKAPKFETTVAKVFLYSAGGYLLILFLTSFVTARILTGNLAVFWTFHLLGLTAVVGTAFQAARQAGLGSELQFVTTSALMWVAGASFYFYMPIASMTNPPMNWGYPRTVEGFKHALTRGQYEQTNPTSSIGRFVDQVWMYADGAINEFGLVYLLVGLVLIALIYPRMQKRERAWMVGLTAIGICLAFLLLILLNPNTDLQSRTQARVFFTASHIILAIFIGYAVTLLGGMLATQYQQYRSSILWGSAIASGIELYFLFDTIGKTQLPTHRYAAQIALGVAVLFTLCILLGRHRAIMPVLLAAFAFMPARSILGHWAKNEQRGHLFGYWFGHDMFSPPFGIYPEMDRKAILFGGTDPGRFNPTYMIFCESFLPSKYKPHDPDFDRRDVYLITQNALADTTYLDYIRAHYNRSTQIDPYFFSELVRTERERVEQRTNLVARALLPLDRFFTDLGDKIEKERRERGVYPPKEIKAPSKDDSQQAFNDYIMDAARRLQHDTQFPNEPKQVKPGEGVHFTKDGRVQVSGQIAVMSINGLLTKIIFDKNPDHEFFVEESFPLDWMFPHLSPFGIIMKINRQPLTSLPEEMLQKDHQFWTAYSERLIGNWVTYDTSIKEICDFAERLYLRHDFTGFKGDRKFIRDDFGQKAFSKLRSAIGGIYQWRLGPECPLEYRPKTIEEQQRLLKEADFALRQAYAFCPASPEAMYKLITLLVSANRLNDALLIAETSLKFDPTNPVFLTYATQLRAIGGDQTQFSQAQSQFAALEKQFRDNPTNLQLGMQLATAYMTLQRYDAALSMLEQVSTHPTADVSTLIAVAQSYGQIGQKAKLDETLLRLRGLLPKLTEQFRGDTNNTPLAFQIVSGYLVTEQTDSALTLVDELVARTNADPSTLLSAATVYHQVQQWPKLEPTLERLVALIPSNPEAWYDLAGVQAIRGKTAEAIRSLESALQLSRHRLTLQPGSRDLKSDAARDNRFASIRSHPEFQRLMQATQ